MQTKKTKEAVSLIVLVLTIVIMIILAGVIVINLNNSGIIDRAKNAVSETNLKNMQELANVAWGEAYLAIKGEKTAENLKSTMLEKLKGKGVSEEELAKYTFTVTTGGVEVGVNTNTPDEPGTEPEPEVPQINVALNPSGTIPENATLYRGTYIDDGFGYVYDGRNSWEEYEDTYSHLLEDVSIEIYEAGDDFPEEFVAGDVYIYNDYCYVYEFEADREAFGDGNTIYYRNGETTYDFDLSEGWGVAYSGTSSEPGEILESINGKPIKTIASAFAFKDITKAPAIPKTVINMFFTFASCESLITAPEIPDGVVNMDMTFEWCESLTTAPKIPASVDNMSNTFYNCESLTGTITIHATPTDYSSTFEGTGITEVSQILGECKNKEELLGIEEPVD